MCVSVCVKWCFEKRGEMGEGVVLRHHAQKVVWEGGRK